MTIQPNTLWKNGFMKSVTVERHSYLKVVKTYEPGHEISNNKVCATSQG